MTYSSFKDTVETTLKTRPSGLKSGRT